MDSTIEFDGEVVTWCPSKEEMTTNTAASGGCIQIGCVAVNVEDHVGGPKMNGGIGMSGTVVEELSDG